MIALRRKIERGMRHPLLGPLLLVLLALLFVLVALHGTHDQAHAAGAELVCVALAVLFLVVVHLRPLLGVARPIVRRRRAPPPFAPPAALVPHVASVSAPLRL